MKSEVNVLFSSHNRSWIVDTECLPNFQICMAKIVVNNGDTRTTNEKISFSGLSRCLSEILALNTYV